MTGSAKSRDDLAAFTAAPGFRCAQPGLQNLQNLFDSLPAKKGRQNAEKPRSNLLHLAAQRAPCAGRAGLSAFHFRLSPDGCHPLAQLQAMLPGGHCCPLRGGSVTVIASPSGEDRHAAPRALPAPACPSPGSQHPLRSSCRNADAQSRPGAEVTSPCPRAPIPRPANRSHAADVLLRERGCPAFIPFARHCQA